MHLLRGATAPFIAPTCLSVASPTFSAACSDASIALATMEVDPANCTKKIVSELSMAEQQVLLDWVSKYRMKYPVMGFLTEGSHPVTVAEAKTKGWDK